MQPKYALNSRGRYGFFTGKHLTGEQFIVGIYDHDESEYVAVVFNTTGEFLRVEKISYAPNEKKEDKLEYTLRLWRTHGDFTLDQILVSRFRLEGLKIGIEAFPNQWDLEDGIALSPDEITELQEDKVEWQKRGEFVFWWRRDYWLNGNGEVIAS